MKIIDNCIFCGDEVEFAKEEDHQKNLTDGKCGEVVCEKCEGEQEAIEEVELDD